MLSIIGKQLKIAIVSSRDKIKTMIALSDYVPAMLEILLIVSRMHTTQHSEVCVLEAIYSHCPFYESFAIEELSFRIFEYKETMMIPELNAGCIIDSTSVEFKVFPYYLI